MRTRSGRVGDRQEPPDRLLTYRRGDWPDHLTEEAAFNGWRLARERWWDEHGWPGGVLERLRQERDTRHRLLFGRPPVDPAADERARQEGSDERRD